PVQHDLEDPARLLPFEGAHRMGGLELLDQHAHDMAQLALLGLRKMIEAGTHDVLQPVAGGAGMARPNDLSRYQRPPPPSASSMARTRCSMAAAMWRSTSATLRPSRSPISG